MRLETIINFVPVQLYGTSTVRHGTQNIFHYYGTGTVPYRTVVIFDNYGI